MGLLIYCFLLGLIGFFIGVKFKHRALAILFVIPSVFLILFSVAGASSSLENYFNFEEKVVEVQQEHKALSAVAANEELVEFFETDIKFFNNQIRLAKKYDNIFLRWVFVSPAYLTVDEITY